MSNYSELLLADGTAVRFELTPAEGARGADPVVPGQGQGDPAEPSEDLPEGMGRSVPVARGDGRVAALVTRTLQSTLSPLGPLLQEVHDAVLSSERPPQEVSVTFGIQIGSDLKFGIVSGNSQTHLTVSATWQPAGNTG